MGGIDAREEHYSGASMRALLTFAEGALGAAAIPDLCARAGEERPLATLVDPGSWSDYVEFRRLAETIAKAIGGAAQFQGAPFTVWDASPGLADDVQALTSLDALLGRVGALSARYQRVTTLASEKVADGEWLIHQRYHDGFEPFPAHCAFARGLLAQAPLVFGLPAAEVIEESCQARGADRCTMRLTLDTETVDAATRDALHTRVLEARLESIQDTIGDLASIRSLDAVLERVVGAVSRAVLARGFVLSVVEPSSGRRLVAWDGLTETDARQCADGLDRGGLDDRWTVVPVAGRDCYGNLAAIRLADRVTIDDQRVLEAYARVTAAAIESADAVVRASRQADVATALLKLSRSLARIGSVAELGGRVVHAARIVLDCDGVLLAVPHGDEHAKVVAAHGFGLEKDRALLGRVVRVTNPDDTFHVLHRDRDLTPAQRDALADAELLAAVQLRAGHQVVGWLCAVVYDRPERLLQQPDLEDRVRGLASMAGTALRNAQLLDSIRFQADHDPLTGLANLRLFQEHARTAVARARRDGERVAVLFLDLDGFKDVNDRLGHAEGDRLLRIVAARIQGCLRESDTLARVGGDEFIALLPQSHDGGHAVVDKVRAAVTAPYQLGATSVSIDVSIGVAVFADDGEDIDTLIRIADVRMYEQKESNRKMTTPGCDPYGRSVNVAI